MRGHSESVALLCNDSCTSWYLSGKVRPQMALRLLDQLVSKPDGQSALSPLLMPTFLDNRSGHRLLPDTFLSLLRLMTLLKGLVA